MPELSQETRNYLKNQYVFSKLIENFESKITPVDDKVLKFARGAVASNAGRPDEQYFSEYDLKSTAGRTALVNRFKNCMNYELRKDSDAKDRMTMPSYHILMTNTCHQAAKQFDQDYEAGVLNFSTTGMRRGMLAGTGVISKLGPRESVQINLDTLGAYEIDFDKPNGFFKSLGEALGKSQVSISQDYFDANLGTSQDDARLQRKRRGRNVKSSGSYEDLLEGQHRDGVLSKAQEDLGIEKLFSAGYRTDMPLPEMLADFQAETERNLNTRPEQTQRRELTESERQELIKINAQKAAAEPDLISDAEYIAMYERWKNDKTHVPIPNTSSPFAEPCNLRLSNVAGQTWSSQHCFGRAIDAVEHAVFEKYGEQFKPGIIADTRYQIVNILHAEGSFMGELDLNPNHDDNDIDKFAGLIQDGLCTTMPEYGKLLSQNKMRKSISDGISRGFYEFSRELESPKYHRSMLLLNTRGLPENYRSKTPGLNSGHDVVAVYLDELGDRFPDQDVIYGPREKRPDGAVSFESMLQDTPVYETIRQRGARYLTGDKVHDGLDMIKQVELHDDEFGAVEIKKPSARDVSDLALPCDIGESQASHGVDLWY